MKPFQEDRDHVELFKSSLPNYTVSFFLQFVLRPAAFIEKISTEEKPEAKEINRYDCEVQTSC